MYISPVPYFALGTSHPIKITIENKPNTPLPTVGKPPELMVEDTSCHIS